MMVLKSITNFNNNLIMNGGKYGLFAGIVLILMIPFWIYFVVPQLESMPIDYYHYQEQIGVNRIVENIGESLPAPFVHHNAHTLRVIDDDNDELVIESHLVASTDSGYTFLDETKHYEVNRKSRINHDTGDGFFTFPSHTSKQDYFMTFPLAFTDALYSFDGVDVKNGLEVYRFNCISEPYDITNAIPQFSDQPIISYYSCKIWVEPVTGDFVDFELNWESYYESGSTKILVEQGGKQTTPQYVDILVSNAQNKKFLYLFYEQAFPLVFGFIGIFSFLLYFRTRSKNVETVTQENITLNQNLQELQKIYKMKEEFLAMISHELKTPLTPISLWTGALKNEKLMGSLTDDQREAVNAISDSADDLTRLISDIFDSYKLDLKQMSFTDEKFNIKELVDDVCGIIKQLGKTKNISIINKTVNIGEMVGDPKRISQVLRNLINNSIDFVPAGTGKITVEATLQNDSILFSVKDNGVGISKEHQEKLFHKFYQVDTSHTREHGGSGLGLSICSGLVRAMNGKIWVHSTPGQGATFYFSLPKKSVNLSNTFENPSMPNVPAN